MRPGTIPFRLPAGSTIDGLLDTLALGSGQAQIIGAEGTGKTTLLGELAERALERGWATARARAPRLPLPDGPATSHGPDPPCLLCLDEADRLDRRALGRLQDHGRRRGRLLAVTTHRELGLPTLHRCEVSSALAVEVARAVLARSPELPAEVAAEEAATALARCEGNLREALLLMYDWYEDRWTAARRDERGPARSLTPSARR